MRYTETTRDFSRKFSLARNRAVPVVPAPDEATITEYIETAQSEADHWDALVKAAATLREHRQPFGGALSDWLIEAAGRNTSRPKGTTAAKWPAGALRDHTIISGKAG